MQGLNIRIPPLAMWVETFEALGANGQTINFGEAYTALLGGGRRHRITLESLWAAKFAETQKVISMTGHFTNWIAPMMSAQVFGALPAETQQILLEEAEIGGEIITALALDREHELAREAPGGRGHIRRRRRPRRLPGQDEGRLRAVRGMDAGTL